MENNTSMTGNEEFLAILMLILVIVAMCLGSIYIKVWVPFNNERRYIKMEIERSTGDKKNYWKRRLRILYLLHIPIIGVFIVNWKYKR